MGQYILGFLSLAIGGVLWWVTEAKINVSRTLFAWLGTMFVLMIVATIAVPSLLWLRERKGWNTPMMAVIVIGAVSGAALGYFTWYLSAEKYAVANPLPAVPSAQDIARELSGGKNFCYFSLYFINNKPVVIDGKFQLAMTGVGVVEKLNYWIAPASAPTPTGKPNDPYYSLDVRKPLLEICHDGGRAWDRTLGVGEYKIDFSAKNGNWYELLKIYISNGEIRESIRITNAKGDVLYDSGSAENIKKQ